MNKPIKSRILSICEREPETLDELAHSIISVINTHKNADSFGPRKHTKVSLCKVVGFAWDIHHSDSVSNTHSSPEGYPQNWGGKKDLPRGYPGWVGRVWIRYDEKCHGFGSDPFNRTLTHTGTGGFGGYSGPWERLGSYCYRNKTIKYPSPEYYSWDYRFYELDWPLLALYVEQQKIWSILSEKPWNSKHSFKWEDPETLRKDSEFIAECAKLKAEVSA